MNKRIGFGVAIGIIGGSIVVGALSSGGKGGSSVLRPEVWHQKVDFLGDITNQYYIDEVDKDKVVEGIYKGFVFGAEDENTVYLTAEEFEKVRVEANGDYIGTGIQFAWGSSKQNLIVVEVVTGSPAEKAGIKVGDKITEIDDIKAMLSNEVLIYEKISHAGLDEIKYVVEDNGGGNKRVVKLKVDTVKRELIRHELLKDNVGYVELRGMKQGIATELEETLQQLKDKGATAFILDLRGTYSDNIEETKAIGDLFLDEKLLFSVKGKDGALTPYITKPASFKEPMVIITDKYTEGTLESLVAALKAYDRGTVVGEKTAGNATVQELVPLGDGSGLQITTGILLTPDNKPIEETGIVPDIEKRTRTEEWLEIVTTGRLEKEDDSFLQEALKVLKK